jgi:predicted RNA-binding Zn-ribbon protein involved in translation (DUF1610 family)
MGSLKRKMARQAARRTKKEMKKQINLFHKLGEECTSCLKSYDKNLEEHVTTWKVVVRERENVVRLYCPECWNAAMKAIEEVENGE